MPREQVPGKPTTRRYSEEEKAQAVRLVRQLRAELGTEHGTIQRVADQLGYGVETVRKWAEAEGMTGRSDAQLLGDIAVHNKVAGEIKKALRDLAHYEMPKKFLLLARDFSIEAGELTPTLKVKRRVVEKLHQAKIDELYAAGSAEVIS